LTAINSVNRDNSLTYHFDACIFTLLENCDVNTISIKWLKANMQPAKTKTEWQ